MAKKIPAPSPAATPAWTFLTNHSHVLICLARNPTSRVREVAQQVGITERAVLKILGELELGEVIQRHRDGRRNHYRVQLDRPLRHPVESHCTIRQLLQMVLAPHELNALARNS